MVKKDLSQSTYPGRSQDGGKQKTLQPGDLQETLAMDLGRLFMLQDSVCCCIVEDFCISVHEGYWPVALFSCSDLALV